MEKTLLQQLQENPKLRVVSEWFGASKEIVIDKDEIYPIKVYFKRYVPEQNSDNHPEDFTENGWYQEEEEDLDYDIRIYEEPAQSQESQGLDETYYRDAYFELVAHVNKFKDVVPEQTCHEQLMRLECIKLAIAIQSQRTSYSVMEIADECFQYVITGKK